MHRRHFLIGTAALTACPKPADFCDSPQITDDGPYDGCEPTASQIEGPFYLADAPERADLTGWDEGELLELEGIVFDGSCGSPVAGAVVELWHANPKGAYDNNSDDMRYRARLVCDAQGRWSVRTLMPGRYLNGAQYRPAHIHLKVWVDEAERLTTQLYFEGDPYLECDPFANTSLVIELADGRGTFDMVV